MVALKGKPDIGDQINKKIIAPLANANKLSDFPDFNDAAKLGSGKEMVDRLTNLIAIFENPALDFSKNRAEGDDILSDMDAELAADQGHATAQRLLGAMYANGLGVTQDYAEAVRWYRLAADQGDADAQYNLGMSYNNGEGLPQDDVAAHMWSTLPPRSRPVFFAKPM